MVNLTIERMSRLRHAATGILSISRLVKTGGFVYTGGQLMGR